MAPGDSHAVRNPGDEARLARISYALTFLPERLQLRDTPAPGPAR